MTFDWRTEFERQHGYRPGAAVRLLSAPYKPVIVELPDAGLCEFVLADRMTFSRRVGNYDELVDVETRRVIGFAWPIGVKPEITEAPTATAGSGHQPAPAKASDQPGGEASPGGATVNPSEPAEIILPAMPATPPVPGNEGESGAPNFERVEIAPNQFVNLTAAEKLRLVKAARG